MGRKNRQRLRVDMSEVDFMYVVILHPNWSKPSFCIIQYEPIMKNVERASIFLKYIFRSRQRYRIDMSEVNFTKVVI